MALSVNVSPGFAINGFGHNVYYRTRDTGCIKRTHMKAGRNPDGMKARESPAQDARDSRTLGDCPCHPDYSR